MFDLVEVSHDGSKRKIAEGYPSRHYAYASATKLAIEAPKTVSKIEVVDKNGTVLSTARKS